MNNDLGLKAVGAVITLVVMALLLFVFLFLSSKFTSLGLTFSLIFVFVSTQVVLNRRSRTEKKDSGILDGD
ncbi:MAG: hypothetical protein GY796_29920 [Chloroflexi bacterium]|nr:hypothetical protein [Chloroflexota bacterium]